MHRILLYTLVVALLYLACEARRGEVLAGAKQPASPDRSALTANSGNDSSEAIGSGTARAPDPAFQARLEARVEARQDFWAQFELETPAGPPAEEVLADAESWMEANFPEGGVTAKTTSSGELDAGNRGADELAARSPRNGEGQDGNAAGEDPSKLDGVPPIYVASLARIESMSGDLPAWCGLLDLALQPAGSRPFEGGLDFGDTAWISDDRGRLIARVEALDGMGLELDPSWPWIARQRRLFWTEGGAGGLPARQYRLILSGNGFVPSWSGRLVLIRSGSYGGPNR